MRYRGKVKKEIEPVNEHVWTITRSKDVMVIDDATGEQLGVMDNRAAVELAYSKGLDLFCVAIKAKPPVCKILDYGKYKYNLKRSKKEAKKKQTIVTLKEVRFKPRIGDHDLKTKAKRAIEFLNNGDKVKLSMKFTGREQMYRYLGKDVLLKFYNEVSVYGDWEKEPFDNGRFMDAVIKPKKK